MPLADMYNVYLQKQASTLIKTSPHSCRTNKIWIFETRREHDCVRQAPSRADEKQQRWPNCHSEQTKRQSLPRQRKKHEALLPVLNWYSSEENGKKKRKHLAPKHRKASHVEEVTCWEERITKEQVRCSSGTDAESVTDATRTNAPTGYRLSPDVTRRQRHCLTCTTKETSIDEKQSQLYRSLAEVLTSCNEHHRVRVARISLSIFNVNTGLSTQSGLPGKRSI